MIRWKNRLKIEIVKALTIVNTHLVNDFSCSEIFSQLSKEKCFWNRFTNLINIQMNLGRLSQSGIYILFLYEYCECRVSKLIILSSFLFLLIFILSRFLPNVPVLGEKWRCPVFWKNIMGTLSNTHFPLMSFMSRVCFLKPVRALMQ
jgi:hypothetical protein